MIVNKENLAAVFAAVSVLAAQSFGAYVPQRDKVAMEVPSTVSSETYAWLGSFPDMREWIGERQYKNLKGNKYTIENITYESTVGIPKKDIEDDKIGLFNPVFSEMGRIAAAHPDKLVYGKLVDGFTELCFDGLPFFSATHKVGKTTVSNMDVPQSNPAAPWFLLDTSRSVKPLIYQLRKAAEFGAMTDAQNEHVFKNGEYLYGVEARYNVGFALWQLAFGVKKALDSTTYAAARAAMGAFKNDSGVPMGVKGNLLVCGPSNEAAARKLLMGENDASGATNPWKGTAEVLVVPWLA